MLEVHVHDVDYHGVSEIHFHRSLLDDKRRLIIAMILNIIIPVSQIAGGIYANSMAIISDAIHNFSDFAALFIAFIALKISSKAPTKNYTYGFGKSEAVAALINSILLVVASGLLIKEAIERFLSVSIVSGPWVITLAAVGVVGNGFSMWLLHGGSKDNLNIRSAFLHMMVDFLTSVAILIVGMVLLFKPWYWLDPVISLGIVVFIVKNCWSISKGAIKMLMDATPAHIDLNAVKETIASQPDVIDVHHLHTRLIAPSKIGFSCHIVVPDKSLGKLEELRKNIQRVLLKEYSINHPTIQFETTRCNDNGMLCSQSEDSSKSFRENRKSPLAFFKKHMIVIFRIFLGGVFVYASIDKILNPKEFAEVVFNYSLLPDYLVNFVAVTLPWIECLAGLAIISGVGIRGGIIISNFLLLIFIVALIANITRGININCGCFEANLSYATKLSMWMDVARDIILLLLGIFLWKKVNA